MGSADAPWQQEQHDSQVLPSLVGMLNLTSELPLELLAVCNDEQVLKSATEAVRKCKGTLSSVTSAETATVCVKCWRVDGIIIDAALADAESLIRMIRSDKCNQDSAIFACVNLSSQGASVIAAGATFILPKPLAPEALLQALRATSTMMTERRRHRRFELTTGVDLTCGRMQQRAIMVNLSEAGMAIRAPEFIIPSKTIAFSFQLPNGPFIDGIGEIAWRGCTGLVGIRFDSFSTAGHRDLAQWLATTFP
jgi:CheY-like chemotaxis protein